MSNINENMGPVQDNYTQTYVSQYVPMPFEVMQKKAEMEQKEFDTIQDNWAVISSKMGEKVLDVDKPVMQEEVTNYQNTIDQALKEANGDWRKLSGNVKAVASKYRNFITTGEGAKAVARLAEMNEKLEQIKDSELSGRMKKAQSNYLRNKYRADGGVRGKDGGASIEEPILYDESKLADTLVDWISKLKADKGDKIQAYKDKDGKIKYAATGAWTSYSDEELGKIVSKSTTQKGVDLKRIREVASGVYELPDFKDMIDAEMMVGMHEKMNVPLRDENGKIIKDESGKIQYEKRDLTRPEYEQLKFAQKFGFADAFAYMEEETKYKLASDEKAAEERKKKKEQEDYLKKQGIVVKTGKPLEVEGEYYKEAEDVDDDELYSTLEDKVKDGNKNFLFNYSENGQIYNTYKDNFKGQQTKDSDIKSEFDKKFLQIFKADPELKNFVNKSADGLTDVISGPGVNALFKQIADGDDKIIEKMTKAKIFFNDEQAAEFKKLALEKDKETYLNEQRLKEVKEQAIAKGVVTTEKGIAELEEDKKILSDDIITKSKGFLNVAFKKEFSLTDINPKTKEPYTKDQLDRAKSDWQEGVDYMLENFTRQVSGKHYKAPSQGAKRSGLINRAGLLNALQSRYTQAADPTNKAEDQVNGKNFNASLEEYKKKVLRTSSNADFIKQLGGGDANAGWNKLTNFSMKMAVEMRKWNKINDEHTRAEKELPPAEDMYNESLDEKRKKLVSLSLNSSNALSLKDADGNTKNFFMKDVYKDLPISDILDSPLATSLNVGNKETPSSLFPTSGTNALKPSEIQNAIKTSLEQAVFSEDVNPETGTTDIVFTLRGKNFRLPFTINQPKPVGGVRLNIEGYSYSKKDLTERQIRTDLHRARVNSLSHTPVGNYRDGVTIRTKEPGIYKEFSKNFNFNFSDGGAYKISIDPTAVGINIPLENGRIRKQLDLSGIDAVKFIKIYKNSEQLEGDTDAAKKRREKFYKAFPRFDNMNAREITRQLVRERVYELFPESIPTDYKKPERQLEKDSFRYGRRYSQGRRGTSSFQPRIYSYPDGLKPGEAQLTPQQLDSIIDEEMNMYAQYADSSAVVTREPEPEIDYSNVERTPYPFEAITGRTLSEIGSQDSVVQQDNTQPVPEQSQDQFPYLDQPSYAESITEAWNPANITHNIRYVDQEGNVNSQKESKVIPIDSLNTQQLSQVQNDIDSTINNSDLSLAETLEREVSLVDTTSTGAEDSLANVRKDNPELNAKLDSLGIEGDITPESLASDLSPYQYEVSDAQTRETYTVDGTPPSEQFGGFALPGQREEAPEWTKAKNPDDYTDKIDLGNGKFKTSGVIRDENLKEFAEGINATELVRIQAKISNASYQLRKPVQDGTPLEKISSLNCSADAHILLAEAGYDLKGSIHTPDPNSKWQFTKPNPAKNDPGSNLYSGGLFHNSIESKKQYFNKTSQILNNLDKMIADGKIKEGQIICFDTKPDKSNWEAEWRQQGTGEGIDHIGVITMIDEVPYILESSNSKDFKGTGLVKLETRLKKLAYKLDQTHYKRQWKTKPGPNEILVNGKVYPAIPKTDAKGNPIYKEDKNGKVIEPKVQVMMKKPKSERVGESTKDTLAEKTKSSIYIGEYKKKDLSNENELESMVAFE